MKWRVGRLAVVSLLAAGCVWFGWTRWFVRRYRAAMAAVDAAMAAGKFGTAVRDLEKVLVSRPGSDEAAYVLGICEQTRGRGQAAQEAWARVAPGSSFLQRAILAPLRQYHDTGRLAAAEQIVIDAAADLRNDRTDLLVLLALKHLPSGESSLAQDHRLNAWLAGHRGDLNRERRELERLIAVDPGDLTALDRLVALAEADRQPVRAAELRRDLGRLAGD